MSIRDKSNKHAQMFISLKKIYHKTRYEMANSKGEKGSNEENKTLYTYDDGTKYQDEKCLSSKERCHRDPTPNKRTKCHLKTTNIQSYIGLLPHNLCII